MHPAVLGGAGPHCHALGGDGVRERGVPAAGEHSAAVDRHAAIRNPGCRPGGARLLLGAGLDAGGEPLREQVPSRGPARVDGPAELAVFRCLDVQAPKWTKSYECTSAIPIAVGT